MASLIVFCINSAKNGQIDHLTPVKPTDYPRVPTRPGLFIDFGTQRTIFGTIRTIRDKI